MVRRLRCIVALFAAALLGSPGAAAEGMKSTSMSTILWVMALAVAGIPLTIGGGAFGVVFLIRNQRPSLLATMLTAFGSWWGGLWLVWQQLDAAGPKSSLALPGIMFVVVLTAGVAFASTFPTKPGE